jgi:hypothetical protein
MSIKQVGKFTLNQQGGYVARTMFIYVDENGQEVHSQQTGNELVDQSYTTDPGTLGVPDGSLVSFYLWVMAGNDERSTQIFQYTKGSPNTAVYMCNGTTLIGGKLHFQGITQGLSKAVA